MTTEQSSYETPIYSGYQQSDPQEGAVECHEPPTSRVALRRNILFNFVWMSILFSANHGSVVACLGVAVARLGSIGAWQNGLLYLTYTASALLGATYVVKRLGPRNSLAAGMGLYCAYVGCFLIATLFEDHSTIVKDVAVYSGAVIGGVGAGFLWTAQGAYFGLAADDYANASDGGNEAAAADARSFFAGLFAFIYLLEEVLLRLLSWLLLEVAGISWAWIFGIYTVVASLSALGMQFTVHNYQSTETNTTNALYKVTAAWRILRNDPKMKYMIGLNAVFGFAAAFINSYVNGEVVETVLADRDSKYVGVFTAWVALVAAVMSLVFGRFSQIVGKGPILIAGAVCFFWVGLLFVLVPTVQKSWGWYYLLGIYTLHGTGRATFEGTLRATFADFFDYEKEGAFANIVLQNGLASAIGFVLSIGAVCSNASERYCEEYSDGTLHNVLWLELSIAITAVLAVLGYLRASRLHRNDVVYEMREQGDGIMNHQI